MNIAYDNPFFMNGSDARALRILAEYLEPKARLTRLNIMNTIVFFGSARIPAPQDHQNHLVNTKPSPALMTAYYKAAEETAYLLSLRLAAHPTLSAHDYVICTGGGPGIMEAGNRGSTRAGARSIAFGIQLPLEQEINSYVATESSFNFHYFFMRKYWFAYLAKAVIVFPGGFGTLDELFETLTLLQTQKMKKKFPIVLYGKDFWTRLIDFDFLLACGLISAADREYFVILDTPLDVVTYVERSLETLHAFV